MHNYKAQIGQQAFLLSESEINDLDLTKSLDSYYLLDGQHNYKVELVSADNKTITVKVNNNIYSVQIADAVDQLVAEMGLDKPAEVIMKDVKAPMPGLILDILVTPGTAIKAGDPLLILEAMKMENVLKATGDGVVKSILLEKGRTVEKNQIILEME